MAIGSVSPGTGASAYTAAGTRVSRNDATVAKLDRSADERAQLEYLGKHLHALKDALATIREHWRRSDEPIPRGAAGVVSLAVLAAPGDETRAMGELAAFGDVGAGTLTVNGTAIAFDAGVDSLADLAARINAAGSGATAVVDTGSGRLLLTGDDPAANLVLDDGGSGLLEALGVAAGSHRPTSSGRTPGMAWSRAGTIAEAFGEAVAALNAIFAKEAPGGEPASFLIRTRGDRWRAFLSIVAPQALPLSEAGDRRTRKMSPAAGVEGDEVVPDYLRDSQVRPPRAHGTNADDEGDLAVAGPPQRGAAAPA